MQIIEIDCKLSVHPKERMPLDQRPDLRYQNKLHRIAAERRK
jgi:hypothetical protein